MTDMIPPPTTEELDEQDAPQPIKLMPLAALLLMVGIFIIGLGTGYLIWARPLQARVLAAEQQLAGAQSQAAASQTAVAAQPNQQAAEQQEVRRYPVPIDDDPILGNPDAKITIIEFSDYNCGYCRKWQNETLPLIMEKYGDDVRLVYRDFPILTHGDTAAEAANCAGEQGQYFPYHDLLFSGQMRLGPEAYVAYAQQLKLDMTAFNACVAERRYRDEVQADFEYASQLGVRSTPTFFVNGLAVVGAQPFEVFEQLIDMELAGKIP